MSAQHTPPPTHHLCGGLGLDSCRICYRAAERDRFTARAPWITPTIEAGQCLDHADTTADDLPI